MKARFRNTGNVVRWALQPRLFLLLVADGLIAALALGFAFVLRYEGQLPPDFLRGWRIFRSRLPNEQDEAHFVRPGHGRRSGAGC